MRHLWIDADACPVVDIAIRTALRHNVKVTLVCDDAHHMRREGAETITVLRGADSADLRLVNLLKHGDIAVTQDYGLAALCLARGCTPIRQDGLVYTADNIDALLMARHESGRLRRGGVRLKGPKKRTAADDAAFLRSLCSALDQRL